MNTFPIVIYYDIGKYDIDHGMSVIWIPWSEETWLVSQNGGSV